MSEVEHRRDQVPQNASWTVTVSLKKPKPFGKMKFRTFSALPWAHMYELMCTQHLIWNNSIMHILVGVKFNLLDRICRFKKDMFLHSAISSTQYSVPVTAHIALYTFSDIHLCL